MNPIKLSICPQSKYIFQWTISACFLLENFENYPENKFFSIALISIRFKNLLVTLHQHLNGRHFFLFKPTFSKERKHYRGRIFNTANYILNVERKTKFRDFPVPACIYQVPITSI